MDPIKEAFDRVKQDIVDLKSQLQEISTQITELKRTSIQTDTYDRQTDRHKIQTVPQEIGGLKPQNSTISTGNEGVPTDRQTHRQTDRHTERFALEHSETRPIKDQLSQIDKVSELINSLDAIKKDLRSKFKKLTHQEMLVFSSIYKLTDDGLIVDYSLLANKTNLSESSIRDYVQSLIKKGVPLIKTKENNKKITLTISPDFKKMASLSTINTLRDI